jgi:hypothetical protein
MRLSAIAVHESAHGVVAEHLHATVTDMSIVADAKSAGHINYRHAGRPSLPGSPKALRQEMRVQCQVSLAGPAAEALFLRESIWTVLGRNPDDLRDARRAAIAIALAQPTWSADAHKDVFRELLVETRELLEDRWDIVLALAETLQMRKTMTSAEVVRVLHFAQKRQAA